MQTTKKIAGGKSLRVLVEVDLMKPLARGKILELIGQRRFVQFKYERLPRLYLIVGLLDIL